MRQRRALFPVFYGGLSTGLVAAFVCVPGEGGVSGGCHRANAVDRMPSGVAGGFVDAIAGGGG